MMNILIINIVIIKCSLRLFHSPPFCCLSCHTSIHLSIHLIPTEYFKLTHKDYLTSLSLSLSSPLSPLSISLLFPCFFLPLCLLFSTPAFIIPQLHNKPQAVRQYQMEKSGIVLKFNCLPVNAQYTCLFHFSLSLSLHLFIFLFLSSSPHFFIFFLKLLKHESFPLRGFN